MNQVTLKITGMKCSMCEAHICDTIRKAVPDAKKVKASAGKKSAQFLTQSEVREQDLKDAVSETGYVCEEVSVEPYEKKGLFGRRQ